MARLFKSTVLGGSVAVCLLAGCQGGVLSPRSGEIFQTTRGGPGPVSVTPILVGALLPPLSIVAFPLGFCTVIVDECIVSPVVDIVCLPYDLSMPRHGFTIRVVDEDGVPIPGVLLTAKSEVGALDIDSHEKETTDEKGEIYVSHIQQSYRLSDIRAAKEGFYDTSEKRFSPSEAEPGEDGRIVLSLTMRKVGRKVKMSVSKMSVPEAVMQREATDLYYDCERGAWLPPYGDGVVADLKLTYRTPEPTRHFHSNRASAEISAARPDDGLLVRPKFNNSGLLSDREAPLDGGYVQTSKECPLSWSWERRHQDSQLRGRYCVFRVRTERDSEGRIVRAHYGKLMFEPDFCYPADCYYCLEENERSLESE